MPLLLRLLRDLELGRLLAVGQGEQVVILITGDLHVDELADGEFARHVDAAINVGGIGFAAGDAGFLDEDLDGFAHVGFGDIAGDSLLQCHQLVPAGFLHLGQDLVGHLGATRAVLSRVAENTEAFELGLLDKLAELGDVGVGFAGEADDESSADRDARDAGADALDQVANVVAACLALHAAEHVVADVLERNVDVAGDLRALRDRADELIAPMRRMRVEQADPEIALDGVQFTEKGGERGTAGRVDGGARVRALFLGVHAEEGRILGDQVDLLDAFLHEAAGFLHDAVDRAAAMPAADLRDDAEGAWVVAAFGDLDVRKMIRGEAEARRVVVRDVRGLALDEIDWRSLGLALAPLLGIDLLDDRRDLGHLVQTDEGVDFVMQVAREIFREPLAHAARHDELLLLAALLQPLVLVHFEDVADRLLLGRVDERAGVDDDHVGLFGLGNHHHARLMQMAHHDLAIDEIFGASEGDEADFDHDETVATGENRRICQMKTAVRDRRYERRREREGLLLGLGDGSLDFGIAALVVGDAAFLLDVFVELLTHKNKERREGCAAKAGPESSASITGQLGVDLRRPGVDSARDVDHLGKAIGPEVLGHPQAAATVMALDQNEAIAGQFREIFRHLTHGNVTAPGDRANCDFVGFAHVKQEGAVPEAPGGGGDIDFERDFHGGPANLPPDAKKQPGCRAVRR